MSFRVRDNDVRMDAANNEISLVPTQVSPKVEGTCYLRRRHFPRRVVMKILNGHRPWVEHIKEISMAPNHVFQKAAEIRYL